MRDRIDLSFEDLGEQEVKNSPVDFPNLAAIRKKVSAKFTTPIQLTI